MLESKAKLLKPLTVGQVVQVQNKRCPHSNKWDLSGTITEVLPFNSYLIKMDGSGRVIKRNRQFIKPIVPFLSHQPLTLPNQTFTNELVRHNDDSNLTGPSAGKAGRPSPLPLSNSQGARAKSTLVQLSQPDTLPQSHPMSDATFDAGWSHAVQRAQLSHQNKGSRPEAGPRRAPLCPQGLSPPVSPTQTRSKQVKFNIKRFIEQY